MQYILNETEYQEFLALKKQNSELSRKLADLSAKAHEMERDCIGTSKVLEETRKISARRLETMTHLAKEVRRLKDERVCIAENPISGTIKVISVAYAERYRKSGWRVSKAECLVVRPD